MNRNAEPAERIAAGVVTWFQANARDLPWRRARDPYAIWVSEVMLQQTQVKTVIPYWERWMKLFPTVRHLARAEEQVVLKAWEGLGYYRRARNLHKAARLISQQMDGVFPSRFEDVLDLPGIGRYTAGAICSIAFGQAVPVLDGNVARVLSRVHMKTAKTDLWNAAGRLAEVTDSPSALNQGLMELGAMVCLPRDPACPRCPIQLECAAFQTNRVGEFPKPEDKPKPRHRRFVAVILRRGNAVLVRQRAAELVNGALWEFPNFETARGKGGLKRQLSEFLGEVHSAVRPVATIRHTITNNRITLLAYEGATEIEHAAARLNARWTAISKLQALPFSSAHARLRALLQGSRETRTQNRGKTA